MKSAQSNFLKELWHFLGRNKYLMTIIGFVVIVVFIDQNNVMERIKNHHEITQLKAERDRYQAACDSLRRELDALDTDGRSLERIAREQYGMHKVDEDIYIMR